MPAALFSVGGHARCDNISAEAGDSQSRSSENEQEYVVKADGVIDCGHLMDVMARDIAAAKSKSRKDALQMLESIKAAHADWLEGHNLKGRALRRAGTPFSGAYDDLEDWLNKTTPPKRA